MIRSQYIHDIVLLLLDDEKYSVLRKQADFVEIEGYEYTGSGVFVSFGVKEHGLNFKSDDQHLRLNGVLIKSEEIDIAADATIVVINGLIDYLEIWSYGDVYPNKDPVHYSLGQQWKDDPDNNTIVR